MTTLLHGKLRIIGCVGEGAFGKVYRAHHVALEKHVAVKVLSGAPDQKAVQRFTTEARAASQLDHPNTVRILDFGADPQTGMLYLAMEFLEGRDLSAVLETEGAIAPIRAAAIAAQICSALSAAHALNIVHRDIKPSNIMLLHKKTEDGDFQDFVKVLDFGVAKVLDENAAKLNVPKVTVAGTIVGTPGYMSPEQIRGESLDGRADLYSCGVLLYEMLTGHLPFEDASSVNVMLKHLSEPPPTLPPAVGRAEPRLKQIIARAMAKDKDARYQEAREMRDALREIVNPNATTSERSIRPANVSATPLATVASDPPKPPMPVVLYNMTAADLGGAQAATVPLLSQGFTLVESEAGLPPTQPRLRMLGIGPDRLGPGARITGGAGEIERATTLACVDVPLETEGVYGLAEIFDNIMVRPLPLDPFAVSVALSWMRRPQAPALHHLNVDIRAIHEVQVNSTALRSFYLESILKEARAAQVSRSTERSLGILCEEMVMNAIFHAPVDDKNQRRYVHMNRASRVTVEPHEEATLSWVVTDRYVALSIRDRFGSYTTGAALRRIMGDARKARLDDARGSAGMGLKLILRASSHLFISISPGNWMDVLALVERTPGRGSTDRTLFVMRPTAPVSKKIGDNLSIVTVRGPGGVRMQLSGEINETSDLQLVYAEQGEVTVDLSEVTLVNSAGLYNWLTASGKRTPGLVVRFEACSPVTVNVINVSELAESSRIVSVQCPYYCTKCAEERLELVAVEAISRDEISAGAAPGRWCRVCGSELEFDGMVEEYFAFLLYAD